MVGCDSCEEKTKSEIQKKIDSGGELTEDEQNLMDGGDLPKLFGIEAYGPLSNYDGTSCDFCVKAGVLVSFLITMVAWGASEYTSTSTVYGIDVAIILVVLLLAQGLMVGIFGRYLVLGPIFGPFFERVLASFNIYVSEQGREKYATDGGAVEAVTVGEEETFDEVSRDKDKEKLFRMVDNKEQEITELKNQIREKKKERQEVLEKKREAEERAEKYKSNLQQKREQIKTLATPGGKPSEISAILLTVPDPSGDFEYRTFYSYKIVEWNYIDKDGREKTCPVPLGAWDPKELGEIPQDIPDAVDDETSGGIEEWLMFHPEELQGNIDFRYTSHNGYDPHEHNALIQGNPAKMSEARSKAKNGDVEPNDVSFRCLVAYSPPESDEPPRPAEQTLETRGHEARTRYKQQMKEYKKMHSKKKSQMRQIKENNEMLQTKVQNLREENEDLSHRIRSMREQLQQSKSDRQRLEENNYRMESQIQSKQNKLERKEREREELLDEYEETVENMTGFKNGVDAVIQRKESEKKLNEEQSFAIQLSRRALPDPEGLSDKEVLQEIAGIPDEEANELQREAKDAISGIGDQ